MTPIFDWHKKHSGPGRNGLALLGFFAGTLAISVLGAGVTASSVTGWYQTLAKPPLTPPDWVFGPVWTILFVLMALAAWLVWKKNGICGAKKPLTLYGLQLAFNLGWSVLFFGLTWPLGALLEIVVLLGLILATLLAFYRISKPAGILFLPYLLWVSFALYLNAGIWIMN